MFEYPTFPTDSRVTLRACPIEAVNAEKSHAMVEMDVANSRMKDWSDVSTFARSLNFDSSILAMSSAV